MSKRYALTLTEEQVTVVDRALDVYSRLMAGQFEVILHDVMEYNPIPDGEDAKAQYYLQREHLGQQLRLLEPLLTGLPQNTHPSIGSRKLGESARVAYDLIKVIRYHKWQEHGREPSWDVYGREPYQMSQEPLPTIARVLEESDGETG